MTPFRSSNARRRREPARNAAACALAVFLLLGACDSRHDERYAAEKRLFKARTLRDQVAAGGMRPEFLSGALDAYRDVVSWHAGAAGSSKDIEGIVVAAQMELAELEFRAGLLEESRDDFEKAVELAAAVPPAKANALFSAAVISEELGDGDRAARFYERFHREFLPPDSVAGTARMNPRYLIVPIKLGDLAARRSRPAEAARWYREAERLYDGFIALETDPGLLKEARFNLLAALLQGKEWKRGIELARELRGLYPEPRDVSSALFIEAKILESGIERPQDARAVYVSIADRYPREREAPAALLAAAGIDRRAGRLDAARALYERVAGSFRDRVSEAVEAAWQLAEMDERAGRWEEASLRYKAIYADYPETLEGFEAPLRVARAYRAKGETDAAAAAFEQALEHYDKLAGGQRKQSTRIMAEEYAVRTLAENGRWREASDRLVALPDRYPDYEPFRASYLQAASILERELADPSGATRLLETCAAKYSGTDLARAAEKELVRLRGGAP